MIPYLLDPTDLCSPEEIRKAIKEYCIYKICSLLQIGPQVIFTDVYDLVCYNDGIEFQMELCKVVEFNVKRTYAQDLKYCVAKLHASKFAHNDIKPENTLFSPSLKKYVLSDFGLSQSVK
jgi:serine/threonine protein kinase